MEGVFSVHFCLLVQRILVINPRSSISLSANLSSEFFMSHVIPENCTDTDLQYVRTMYEPFEGIFEGFEQIVALKLY